MLGRLYRMAETFALMPSSYASKTQIVDPESYVHISTLSLSMSSRERHQSRDRLSTHLVSPLQLTPPALRHFERLYGTDVRSPLPKEEFYNRTKELAAFRRMLEQKPQVSVISGPINSGKTTLILHLLEEMSRNKEKPRPILHLDLRERSFSNVDELETSLENAMASWADSCRYIFNTTTMDLKAAGTGLKIKRDPLQRTSVERLNDLFNMMSKLLPEYSILRGKQMPILFIDEANKLKSLMKEEDGPKALSNLFEWFIKNTKQDSRFHVILGTSDSFFHLWIEKYVTASRFTSYVVGNLSRQESERFWNEKLLTQTEFLKDLPPPSFEEAYVACDGNMYLLEKYFNEYCASEGDLKPSDFSVVGAEKTVLVNSLRRSRLLDSVSPDESALWTREEYLEVMRMLVEANNNFLFYQDVCDVIDQRVVDALIEANVLHLRPTEKYSYDIPGHKSRPILTAETPSSLLAMREILKEVKEGKLQPPPSRLF